MSRAWSGFLIGGRTASQKRRAPGAPQRRLSPRRFCEAVRSRPASTAAFRLWTGGQRQRDCAPDLPLFFTGAKKKSAAGVISFQKKRKKLSGAKHPNEDRHWETEDALLSRGISPFPASKEVVMRYVSAFVVTVACAGILLSEPPKDKEAKAPALAKSWPGRSPSTT